MHWDFPALMYCCPAQNITVHSGRLTIFFCVHRYFSFVYLSFKITMMSSRRKRQSSYQKTDAVHHHSLSCILHPTKNAVVDGVILRLSEMRKSATSQCSFYHGELADNDATLRLVGFDPVSHRTLSQFYRNKQPVKLANCQLKLGRGQDLEIVVHRFTRVTASSERFDVGEELFATQHPVMALDTVPTLKLFQQVTVKAKVQQVYQPKTVGNGKRKQDVILADATGCTQLTLWQEDIDRLATGNSYKLSGVVVRCFNDRFYISVPKRESTIEEIEALESVYTCDQYADYLVDSALSRETSVSEQKTEIFTAEILAVHSLVTYLACLHCSAKIHPTEDGDDAQFGKCSKCSAMQRRNICPTRVTARLLVNLTSPDNVTSKSSRQVFDSTIKQMIPHVTGTITAENLLTAESFPCLLRGNVLTYHNTG